VKVHLEPEPLVTLAPWTWEKTVSQGNLKQDALISCGSNHLVFELINSCLWNLGVV
jgi:hypothetical protein